MHACDLFLLSPCEKIFQDKYFPGDFTKTLIDPDNLVGPVSAACLSKTPNFKIKYKLVLAYLAALGS